MGIRIIKRKELIVKNRLILMIMRIRKTSLIMETFNKLILLIANLNKPKNSI